MGTASTIPSLGSITQLLKIPLCLMVAASALFGHYLYTAHLSLPSVFIFSGIFLLATAAACLNSLQEIEFDGRFSRTKNRPLVTGAVSRYQAAWLFGVLFGTGCSLLFFSSFSIATPLLGIVTLLLYNGVYTPLKTRSALALLAGGVVGAIPPLIGWLSAGGDITAIHIWLVMILFFLWQIPHFFLLMLENETEYRQIAETKKYLPNYSSHAKYIVLVWVMAFSSVSLLFTVLPGLLPMVSRVLLLLIILSSVIQFIRQLIFMEKTQYKKLFLFFNFVMLVTMIIISSGIAFVNHTTG